MSNPIESLDTDTAILEANAIHVAQTFFPELMFIAEADSYAPEPYFIPQSNPGIVQYFIPEGYGFDVDGPGEYHFGPLITVIYDEEGLLPCASIESRRLIPL